MADGNLLPLSNVNAFTTGRVRAGKGWYQGQRPLWMEIAVPAVEGTSKGVQAGLAAYGGGAGGAGAAKAGGATQSAYTASSPSVAQSEIGGGPTLGELIAQSQAQAPEMAAQGASSESFAPGAYPGTPLYDPLALEKITVPKLQTPEEKKAAQRRKDVARALQLLYTPRAARLEDDETTTYIRSTRAVKREITRNDDHRALGEVLNTPVYRYRYYDEPEGTQPRIGPMAEEVPPSWQSPDGHGIRMPVMIGALHASVRALGRDVETLKERLHG